MDAVGGHSAGKLRVVVHEERDIVAATKFPKSASRFGPFFRRVGSFVSKLHERNSAFERSRDGRDHARHGALRRRDEVHPVKPPRLSVRRAQAISPASARLKAIQNGSRSAGRNGWPRSRQGCPLFENAPMLVARIPFRFSLATTSVAAFSSTAIRRVPSLIASSGSIPNTFETSATAGSTCTFARSTSTPRPEACAISQTAFRTPPSVASCIAHTPPSRRPTDAAASASSTVLIDSKRARARFVTSAPTFRSAISGNVFERIAVASSAAVLVTRSQFPGFARFAGPTAMSLRATPKWRAITFSKNERLTFPIGYFGCGRSVTSGGLLRIPGLKTSSCSLRRYDPDQVPRVSPSRGRLSALLGSPEGLIRGA